jgi:hypothetical protein
MIQPVSPSSPDELMEFALLTLDWAADALISSGGHIAPFSLMQTRDQAEAGKKGELTMFVSKAPENGLEQARTTVRNTTDVLLAAVAWDGYLTMEGQRTDAVVVEASAAGDQASILLARRHVAGEDGQFVRLGIPVKAGEGQPLF